MSYGLLLPNWEAAENVPELVDAAIVAEEAGWDGVFLADHLIFPPPRNIGAPATSRSSLTDYDDHRPMPDPWITLAGIATATERIKLGSWVTPVPRRQPWQVAKDLATLDRLSGGRVIFGVGLGRRPDYEQFGEAWTMKAIGNKADEALTLIDRLWTGEPVTHHGAHYRLDDVVLLPTPLQKPRIPIVVGGLWPRKPAVRRGANWDGIVTHFPGDGFRSSDGIGPEEHALAMVSYYKSKTTTPGEIFLPAHPDNASSDWCDLAVEELGATWLFTGKLPGDSRWSLNVDRIREGPLRS